MGKDMNLEYIKEDLLNYIKLGKKIDNAVKKDNIKEQLRISVNRFLDCNQYLEDVEKLYNKSRKLINKYAKSYKREKDIKKYFKDSDNRISNAVKNRFWSIFDLMNVVESILCDSYNIELFRNELPEYEDWFEFEMKDMIFVNTFANSLKQYKRNKIDMETIFYELNYAMKEYIDCIQDGYEYKEIFDNGDGFVNIVCKDHSEVEEQEEKDE